MNDIFKRFVSSDTFAAEPGMGKTCSLALLALKWVEGSGKFH